MIETKKHLSEEHRNKLKENAKINPNYGMKGKHHTEESKKKMSKTFFKKGQVAWNKGKKEIYSKETKKKMIENWRKRFLSSPEMRMRMKNHRATQIFPVKDSKPEKKIQGFLKQIGIDFLTHKYIKIEHSYQCDIFIPSINLVIEVDGDYWHGNPKLYSDKYLTKRIIKSREIDNIRTKELLEKGFNVLRLWESDIEKMTIQNFVERIKSFEGV